MENYSHQSSGDSSPLSREIDSDNPSSWEEPPASAAASTNYKVKFMCSYGGKIQPRSHDNQLSYLGGDTKILSIDRATSFSTVLSKLSYMCNASEICFKYQLPGEDLDALISVTNDEDLEHMMLEYDRLNRISPKPARLRIFMFPVNSKPNSTDEYQFKENTKPEGSWFVDALNSVQFRPADNSSSPPTPPNPELSNPDFLFGFDNAVNYKVPDPNPNSSDVNDQAAVTEPVAVPIQSQIERLRIGEDQVNPNLNSTQIYQSEYYKVQEKVSPAPQQPLQAPIPAGYWPERQVVAGNYPVASGIPADQQPFYVIQTPTGAVYHQTPSVRQVSSQAYYSVPRAAPEAYREQPAYNAVPPPPPPSFIQQAKATAAMVPEQGYTQVGYDNVGRPVYYTIAGGAMTPAPAYQMVNTAAGANGGLGMNPMGVDGKVVAGKGPQT